MTFEKSDYTFLVYGESTDVHAQGIFGLLQRLEQAAPTSARLFAHDVETSLRLLSSRKGVVFICGWTAKPALVSLVNELRKTDLHVLIVEDALEIDGDRVECMHILERESFQLIKLASAATLSGIKFPYLHAHPKPEVSATVVAVCQRTEQVLLVERAHEPFKGMLALPSGFLRPMMETLEQCAVRELKEETNADFPAIDLIPIGIDSNPNRDPRGHVIDHSYLAIVRQPLPNLLAGDDAAALRMVKFSDAVSLEMAADHARTLRKGLNLYRRMTGRVFHPWRDLAMALKLRHRPRST